MLERRRTTTPAATRPAAEALPVPDSFGHPSPSPSSSSSSGSSSSANLADASSVPSSSSPWVVWEHPSTAPAAASSTTDRQQDEGEDERGGQTSIPVPVPVPVEASASSSASSSSASSSGPAGPLLDFAPRVAAEHQTKHGRPITRDALRARLGVSNQLASDLLRQIRTEHNHAAPVA